MKKLFLFSFLAITGAANAQWSLTGNAGTNPTNNFIGTTDAKDLVFRTNNGNAARILGNANRTFVIGTTNPNPNHGYKLYVAGNTGIIGETNIFGTMAIGDTSSNLVAGENLILGYSLDAADDANLLYLENSNSQNYELSSKFVVKANGNVGIGTTSLSCSSCSGYKLFVKDGIRTEKVKVEIAAENGWADYVFAKDYKLMPLKEVENYINNNGHLPEVPSTEEAIQNGIELKEMNILLLKKVEELTLHLIEQDKRIEELEANNKK